MHNTRQFYFRIHYQKINSNGRWEAGNSNRYRGEAMGFSDAVLQADRWRARADFKDIVIACEVDATYRQEVLTFEAARAFVDEIADYSRSQLQPEPKGQWLLVHWHTAQAINRVGPFDSQAEAYQWADKNCPTDQKQVHRILNPS